MVREFNFKNISGLLCELDTIVDAMTQNPKYAILIEQYKYPATFIPGYFVVDQEILYFLGAHHPQRPETISRQDMPKAEW